MRRLYRKFAAILGIVSYLRIQKLLVRIKIEVKGYWSVLVRIKIRITGSGTGVLYWNIRIVAKTLTCKVFYRSNILFFWFT